MPFFVLLKLNKNVLKKKKNEEQARKFSLESLCNAGQGHIVNITVMGRKECIVFNTAGCTQRGWEVQRLIYKK